MKWIRADDLERWAPSNSCRESLPEVVRRAIHGSAITVREINFPAGESINRPGWDGILESADESAFVPKGLSVWEISSGDPPRDKANENYKKRTKDPRAVNKVQATFVFVTPYRFADKDKWCSDKKRKHQWANVRIIDADVLEQWLEEVDQVGLWLAEKLGRIPAGVDLRSLEEEWKRWRACFELPASEGLVLAGREDAVANLRGLLQGAPQIITVKADSAAEAFAFSAASVLATTEDTIRRGLLSRAVVASSRKGVDGLTHRSGLVIVASVVASELAGLLVSKGNHVILCVGNDAPDVKVTITLPRAPSHLFAKALMDMGLDELRAERMARDCGRSPTILRRRLPAATYVLPEWASAENGRVLVPALLAGGWDGNVPGDRAILELLAAQLGRYDDLVITLQRWTEVDAPPLRHVGAVWKLAAPPDAFALLGRRLVNADYERLEAAASEVLGELDPALDLSPDDRPFAALHDKRMRHSAWLRNGLAQTLLLLALETEAPQGAPFQSPESFVSKFVGRLLRESADWRRWASLNDQLPSLAEAAPVPFLEALEHKLGGEDTDLANLFVEEGPFGASRHTGLLWALETLAWSPIYLVRAVIVLCKLAKIDPGGKLLNRPINSLREIFLSWHPGTNARLAQRLQALDEILNIDPNFGWELLLRLLPQAHGISHNTRRPEWREFGDSDPEEITSALYVRASREITSRFLDRIGVDLKRWNTLIENLHQLDPDDRARALRLFETFSRGLALSESDRVLIWDKVRALLSRHRRFADAEWALGSEEINRWQVALDQLTPRHPAHQHAWLFNNQFPEIPKTAEGTDIEATEREIGGRRSDAIRQIFARDGVGGVVGFARTVRFPGIVGWNAPDALNNNAKESDRDAIDQLIELARNAGDEPSQIFLAALCGRCAELYGDTWRRDLVERARGDNWTPKTVAICLRAWPDTRDVWELASALGSEVEHEYWSLKPAIPFKGAVDDLSHLLRCYIKHGRTIASLQVASYRAREVATPLLSELLDRAVADLNKHTEPMDTMMQFHIKQIFGALEGRTDISSAEVAALEYRYLPILIEPWGNERLSLQLHNLLAEDPAFFVEVLSNVYRSASEARSEEKREDERQTAKSADGEDALRRRRAELGYRLLESWVQLPGAQLSNPTELDPGKLKNWIVEARKKARNADRSDVADHVIGKLLAHAPSDPEDEAWPHRRVREVIEATKSEHLEQAIVTERFNMRGAHWRDPRGGGDQERAFAQQAHNWAATVSRGPWLRTAQVLNNVAKMWENTAQQHDTWTQQREL